MDERLSSSRSCVQGSLIKCQNSAGLRLKGSITHLTRHSVIFEVYAPTNPLKTSEVLDEVQITLNERTLYSGQAVVKSLVDAESTVSCEATLQDSWLDVDSGFGPNGVARLGRDFQSFVAQWQSAYRILPEYKLVIADTQSFLFGMRSWLDQVELGTRSMPSAERLSRERAIAGELKPSVGVLLQPLLERFEEVCRCIDPAFQAAHRSFYRRQLHPFLMSSPFMHRIYAKPLGYAGDYEMMRMIWRNDYEGNTLFSKLLTAFILDQPPARSVRNRVEYMTDRIIEETLRVSRAGRTARIFSLGCGPAQEVQNFLAHPLGDGAQFRLLDFDKETLTYVGNRMEEMRRRHHRQTLIELVSESVYHLLREATKPDAEEQRYDLIYSSGLYDYLSDRVSKALNAYLYDRLLPGGVLIVSNFDPSNPIRNLMEYAFEWFLIHRTGKDMAALAPDQAPADACRVQAEMTGCNVFLEVRKPLNSR
jgi:extracellular factor (EF) 3-hydroxypalmitic acid methyl ester biosynthesis protein